MITSLGPVSIGCSPVTRHADNESLGVMYSCAWWVQPNTATKQNKGSCRCGASQGNKGTCHKEQPMDTGHNVPPYIVSLFLYLKALFRNKYNNK